MMYGIDVNNIIILRSIEILPVFIKPRRVHKGYVSHFVCVYVCVCVCLSTTALTATYLVYMSNVRRVSCRLLNICIVWTSLKTFHSRDMALIACHDDQRLGSFSTKNTPMVFDTITNCIVYEPLDKSDNTLN